MWKKPQVLVAQAHPTLCDSMDCTLPGSSVHEILQARTLEWVAVPFSKGSSKSRDGTQVSRIADKFFTAWATTRREKLKECLNYSLIYATNGKKTSQMELLKN